jgi:hypothetical protein
MGAPNLARTDGGGSPPLPSRTGESFSDVIPSAGDKGQLMGKAAENERIKLLAAWYNNISVGLTLTGVLIPVFSLYKADNFLLLHDWTSGTSHPNFLQGLQFVVAFVALCLTLFSAAYFSSKANTEIAKIQD